MRIINRGYNPYLVPGYAGGLGYMVRRGITGGMVKDDGDDDGVDDDDDKQEVVPIKDVEDEDEVEEYEEGENVPIANNVDEFLDMIYIENDEITPESVARILPIIMARGNSAYTIPEDRRIAKSLIAKLGMVRRAQLVRDIEEGRRVPQLVHVKTALDDIIKQGQVFGNDSIGKQIETAKKVLSGIGARLKAKQTKIDELGPNAVATRNKLTAELDGIKKEYEAKLETINTLSKLIDERFLDVADKVLIEKQIVDMKALRKTKIKTRNDATKAKNTALAKSIQDEIDEIETALIPLEGTTSSTNLDDKLSLMQQQYQILYEHILKRNTPKTESGKKKSDNVYEQVAVQFRDFEPDIEDRIVRIFSESTELGDLYKSCSYKGLELVRDESQQYSKPSDLVIDHPALVHHMKKHKFLKKPKATKEEEKNNQKFEALFTGINTPILQRLMNFLSPVTGIRLEDIANISSYNTSEDNPSISFVGDDNYPVDCFLDVTTKSGVTHRFVLELKYYDMLNVWTGLDTTAAKGTATKSGDNILYNDILKEQLSFFDKYVKTRIIRLAVRRELAKDIKDKDEKSKLEKINAADLDSISDPVSLNESFNNDIVGIGINMKYTKMAHTFQYDKRSLKEAYKKNPIVKTYYENLGRYRHSAPRLVFNDKGTIVNVLMPIKEKQWGRASQIIGRKMIFIVSFLDAVLVCPYSYYIDKGVIKDPLNSFSAFFPAKSMYKPATDSFAIPPEMFQRFTFRNLYDITDRPREFPEYMRIVRKPKTPSETKEETKEEQKTKKAGKKKKPGLDTNEI